MPTGLDGRQLEALAAKIKLSDFFEIAMIAVARRAGIATQKYVNEHVGGKPDRIAQGLVRGGGHARARQGARPSSIAATPDWRCGASSANSDSFEPVRIGKDEYVDGDYVSPVPIHAGEGSSVRAW
jgi:hypothetical protein